MEIKISTTRQSENKKCKKSKERAAELTSLTQQLQQEIEIRKQIEEERDNLLNFSYDIIKIANCLVAKVISEQKKTELALQSSEAQWQSLVENTADMIIVTDKMFQIKFINHVLKGFDREKVIGSNALDFVVLREKDRVQRYLEKVLSTGNPVSYEIDYPDAHLDQHYWFSVRASAVRCNKQITGLLLIIRDVTERKQIRERLEARVAERTKELSLINQELKNEISVRLRIEEELKRAKDRLLEGQKIAHVGSWEWYISTNKLWWSEEHKRIFGFDLDVTASYELFYQRILPEDRHIVEKHTNATLAHDAPYQYEHRVMMPDGSIRYHRVSGELKRDEQGIPFKLSGTVQDVTSYKQAEEALRESERRYRTLAAMLPVGIFHTDALGYNLYTNEKAGEIMGLTTEELDCLGWVETLHPEDREALFERWFNAVMSRGRFNAKYRFQHRDGSVRWVLGEACPVTGVDGEITGFIGTLTDITKLHRTEAKLLQHQAEAAHFSRLNQAGELASGIAHELNQPLTAIVNYLGGCLEILQRQNVSQEIITIMQKVMAQAEHAGAIIHRFKNFLRKGKLTKDYCDINALIKEAIGLSEFHLKSAGVILNLQLVSQLPEVKVDKIQIEQVILGMVHNAIEAMVEAKCKKPKITIRTMSIANSAVKIIIEDNGVGIPSQNINKIFNPFFTTKNKGMGIGLSIASSLIEDHGGRIYVENLGTGIGSRFYITLPIKEEDEDDVGTESMGH